MSFSDEQLDAKYHCWKAEYHIAMARKKIKDVEKVDVERLAGALELMKKENADA